MFELARSVKRFIVNEDGQTLIENVGLACLLVLLVLKYGPQICLNSMDLLLGFLLPIWTAL